MSYPYINPEHVGDRLSLIVVVTVPIRFFGFIGYHDDLWLYPNLALITNL